ncbi:MAG: phosphoribosyltransferase family protein [Bacteroidia bacterium]
MALSYSLHKIDDKERCPFSEMEYSNFKFGNTIYAEKFASALFNGFISLYKELIVSESEIILLPSPYHSIPTASNFLCSFFKSKLNSFLFQHGKQVCIETKIHRLQTYVEDYGSMDFEQRISLISNDTYYLDKHFLEGKLCLFLDDIKITGSHERTVNKILNQYGAKGNFLFIYFAELVNKDIHPSIENYYNYFAIKSVQDVINVINSSGFCFNTRIVKYILLLEEENFDSVIKNIPSQKKRELFNLAISNNYHQISDYQFNINKLNNTTLWPSTYKKDKEKASMLLNLQLV